MVAVKRIASFGAQASRNTGFAPQPRDFRDTQSLELPIERVGEPDDPQAQLMRRREAAVHGTAEQRANFLLKEVYVQTPDVTHIVSTMEQLLGHAKLFSNPGGMRIIADSGMGKDALLRYLLKIYPPQPNAILPRYPLIYVDFRNRLAPGEIIKALLEQMQCAYKSYQSVRELEDSLLHAMDACGTQGIVFNEAHHMVSVNKGTRRISARIAGEAGDWLKGFIDRIKRPVFLLGIPGWDEVFDLDPQLGSRIPHRHEISPFLFDASFMGILQALDGAIPMPEPAGLAENTIAQSLYTASRNKWRHLIHLLRDAIIAATKRGSPRIERCDLSWAYRLQFGPKDNPFDARRKS